MDASSDQKTVERYKDSGLALRNESTKNLLIRLDKEVQDEALRMLVGQFSPERFLELRGKSEVIRNIFNESAVFENAAKRLEKKEVSTL